MTGKIFRIKYKRDGSLKFVSHLDFVHVFERAIRRAGIPIAFSNGFNPRMQLVFGNPLSVGYCSDFELFDIELTEDMEGDLLIKKLAETLPTGIEILEYEVLEKPYDNISKIYDRTEYLLEIYSPELTIEQLFYEAKELLNKKEPLMVLKKSKSGDKLCDIMPMIFGFELTTDNKLKVLLLNSQQQSLKPELFMSGICEKIGCTVEIKSILKTRMYKTFEPV